MKYKRIYIEITNVCNLKCSFCPLNERKPSYMTLEQFDVILDKIKGYTDYIYLHVMGEPLMHPLIGEMIQLANNKGFFVQLTTNGYLIEKLRCVNDLRQINLSLQAYSVNYGKSIEDYLNTIFSVTEALSEKGTYVNYRLWVQKPEYELLLQLLSKHYFTKIEKEDKTKTLARNIFYSKENEFVWPIRKKEKGSCSGFCPALRDHLAVLVDGTVVPCCLDNNGIINLGNLFLEDLKHIISSELYQSMFRSFKMNKKVHSLCQSCDFYQNKL